MRGRIELAVGGLAGDEDFGDEDSSDEGSAVAGSAVGGGAALPTAPALHTPLAISAMANPSPDDRFPIVGG